MSDSTASKETVKIGFVLLSSAAKPIPSTRICVLNMLPFLRGAGFDPHIVYEPVKGTETPDISGLTAGLIDQRFDIIFFQKIHGKSVEAVAHALRTAGIRTVYGVCDIVDPDMVAATDATVIVTEYLRSLHPPELQSRIAVVHDGIERPETHKSDWGENQGSAQNPLEAVLVTSVELDTLPVLIDPPSWLRVTIIGRYAAEHERRQRWREARWRFLLQPSWADKWRYLRFLNNPRIRRLAWDSESVYTAMLKADIGIIPVETDPQAGAIERWQVKSENRLTLKMSVGLPVVATPIPAYLPVVHQGSNAFLASDRQQWLDALTALRDPALRRSIGNKARQTALREYSMERQAEKLIAVLNGLEKAKPAAAGS